LKGLLSGILRRTGWLDVVQDESFIGLQVASKRSAGMIAEMKIPLGNN